MFYVKKESIATTLGAQKEFSAAQRRGVGFFTSPSATAGHTVWHYRFPKAMVESSIREAVVAAEGADAMDSEGEQFYIWSQEVTVGELVGEPLITRYFAGLEEDEDTGIEPVWQAAAKQRWASR